MSKCISNQGEYSEHELVPENPFICQRCFVFDEEPAMVALTRMRAALTYISSPTMGLPPGRDAAEFAMDGSGEKAARYALHNCIQTARMALTPQPDHDDAAAVDGGAG